ncbi:hypothetical protein L1887_40736 [Cichorium endivia]|nr:hypothetical protein L1887_40736 [Cichorium endivia]
MVHNPSQSNSSKVPLLLFLVLRKILKLQVLLVLRSPLLVLAFLFSKDLSLLALELPPKLLPPAVKGSKSIYEFDPDDLRGKNKFDILNTLEDSFSVFCEPNGVAVPIVNCDSGTHSVSDLEAGIPSMVSSEVNVTSISSGDMGIEKSSTQVHEKISTNQPLPSQ